jgi:hypothetical protein
VFTGSGSLLLHPSEPIESRNEAEAISGPQTAKAVAAATSFRRLQLDGKKPAYGVKWRVAGSQ